MMTPMCSLTQRLLDDFPAVRAVSTGVVRWHGNRHHAKHLAEILQPIPESRPSRIGDGLGQFFVFDHVRKEQVLIGYQVVRLDYAPCQLYGKVFTLPTYLQVPSRQAISRFSSIVRAFLGTRKSTTKTLESLLRLPEMSWVLDSLPIRVCVEVGQPNIQPNILRSWRSLLNSLDIYCKLNVVPFTHDGQLSLV